MQVQSRCIPSLGMQQCEHDELVFPVRALEAGRAVSGAWPIPFGVCPYIA